MPKQLPKTKTLDEKLPISHRTTEAELRYQVVKANRKTQTDLLTVPSIDREGSWIVIENEFPYDAYYKVSHMAVHLNVVNPEDLFDSDWQDLLILFRRGGYHELKLNAPVKQSVRHQLHFHLLTLKDERSEVTR